MIGGLHVHKIAKRSTRVIPVLAPNPHRSSSCPPETFFRLSQEFSDLATNPTGLRRCVIHLTEAILVGEMGTALFGSQLSSDVQRKSCFIY